MKMRKELNNKGFSLVELLIATVILAIVVAPLLHAFVTAATTTVRSRQLGDATLVSENIAEAVKVNSLSDLFNEANRASSYFAGASESSTKKLYSYDGDSSSYTELTNPTKADCYYLGLTEIKAGSSTFNAMITLDAGAYQDEEDKTGINDTLMTDYSNMDAVYDYGSDVDDPDLWGLAQFRAKAAEKANWDGPYGTPKRTITLHVYEYLNQIYAQLDFQYKYDYSYEVTNETTLEVTRVYGTITTEKKSYALLPNGYSLRANGGRLPNVYLIYSPLYAEDAVAHDTIEIKNDLAGEADIETPLKVFLVKARKDGESDAELFRKDSGYNAKVVQYVPADTPPAKCAVIYSNIDENISDMYDQITEGLEEKPDLDGVEYKIRTGQYFSRDGVFGGELGDLVSKSERDRIYAMTVDIFEASDTNFTKPIHTFQTTKLQ